MPKDALQLWLAVITVIVAIGAVDSKLVAVEHRP